MALKDIFKSKKFYIITVIILTVGIIKLLAIFIYTKDQPKVVPEKTREEVRGGLKEVAEAISVVTPKLSEVLVEAAYTPEKELETDTSDWQTYKSDIYGFEVSYPNSIILELSPLEVDNYLGTLTFRNVESGESGLPLFDVDIFTIESSQSVKDWVNVENEKTGLISEVEPVSIGKNTWTKAVEAGDPDHTIYIYKGSNTLYKFKTTIEEPELFKDVLETFKVS